MINPGGIPRIPGDMEALARHAGELSRVGPAFSGTGQQVNSTWQQLAPVYDAPEVTELLAATGPVQTTSASVGGDITTVGGALATYASTVKQIQDQLDALRTQAQDLVAETEADKATEGNLEKVGEFVGIGGDDDEYAERSNELIGQVNAQVAAFDEAQRVCANTINALYGGTQYRADDGDGQQEPGEYGYTAEQLDTAFEQGQELPWGTYAETDTGIVGGVWDGAKMLVGDLGALIGRDPTTGEWSWATAGTAWAGVGKFALAVAMHAGNSGTRGDSPAIPGIFAEGEASALLVAAGKGIIAYDEWGKGDNARAFGMAGFNVLSSIVGTKGAGGALRGAGAGAQTSRIGAVSRVGGAMVRGGEFIGRLPTTESLALKVRQHLPNLRLPDNIPDVTTPHHTNTPNPNAPNVDAPNVDAPRVDTPNPGSVGDNLADTGRPDAGTPSTPNVPDAPSAPDTPSPRGSDIPPGAVPDAPSTPDTPSTPGDRTPDTDTAGPPDASTGDRPPDNAPADQSAADTTLHDRPEGTAPDSAPAGPTPDTNSPGGITPDGDATPDAVSEQLGDQPDGSWVGEEKGVRLHLDPADNAVANDFIAQAGRAEENISPIVTEIVDDVPGSDMPGYPEAATKSEESLKRKVVGFRVDAPGAAPADLIAGTNDSVRYTAMIPDANYSSGTQQIIDDMGTHGFEYIGKNFAWNDSGGYQGINTTWRDPSTGHLFEMQFHTPSSFAAKDTTHVLYEDARVLPKGDPRRLALMQEQAEIFGTVPIPDGTRDIRFPE